MAIIGTEEELDELLNEICKIASTIDMYYSLDMDWGFDNKYYYNKVQEYSQELNRLKSKVIKMFFETKNGVK